MSPHFISVNMAWIMWVESTYLTVDRKFGVLFIFRWLKRGSFIPSCFYHLTLQCNLGLLIKIRGQYPMACSLKKIRFSMPPQSCIVNVSLFSAKQDYRGECQRGAWSPTENKKQQAKKSLLSFRRRLCIHTQLNAICSVLRSCFCRSPGIFGLLIIQWSCSHFLADNTTVFYSFWPNTEAGKAGKELTLSASAWQIGRA